MLMNKLSPATETTHKDSKQSVPERSLSRGGLTGGTFDYQSFGLKGLAPIVEDDDASSKYESDGESSNNSPVKAVKNKLTTTKSSGQGSTEDGETNSRTSSLSLNNSDYKSSISSGTADADHYAIKGAGVRSHSRNLSTASSGNDLILLHQFQNQDSEMPHSNKVHCILLVEVHQLQLLQLIPLVEHHWVL